MTPPFSNVCHTETLEILQANSDFSTKTSIAFSRCCNTLSQHLTALWKRRAAALSTAVGSLYSLRPSEPRKKDMTSKWIFRHKHRPFSGFKTKSRKIRMLANKKRTNIFCIKKGQINHLSSALEAETCSVYVLSFWIFSGVDLVNNGRKQPSKWHLHL